MTRAALLPAGSDPFLLAYWLRNYATWAQYVDELHVWACGALEPEALAYMREQIAAVPNATLDHVAIRMHHGTVIRDLLHKTKADHIMLCEDDAFVRRPAVVDECFAVAEAGGVAATPRAGYASHEVVLAAAEKLGGIMTDQYAYWPCFVFVSRAALLATDQDFGGTQWQMGEKLFDHTMLDWGGADTFVWASYQLRAQGLTETLIDNHRLSGQVVPDDAPWFHVGSLSSGHGLMWMSDITPDKYLFEVAGFRGQGEDESLKRVAWWWRAWKTAEGAIPEYRERYAAGLGQFREDIDIREVQVEWYQRNVADRLVTWAER